MHMVYDDGYDKMSLSLLPLVGVFLKQILRNKDDSPFIISLLPHILLPEFSLTYSLHFQTPV